MSTRTIPAQVIKSCDCCSTVLSAEANNHREEGQLTLKATALDMHGGGVGDATKRMDLCDKCLQRVSRAIDLVVTHRAVMAPPDQMSVSRAPKALNTNDKAMWVLGWNECATTGFKA